MVWSDPVQQVVEVGQEIVQHGLCAIGDQGREGAQTDHAATCRARVDLRIGQVQGMVVDRSGTFEWVKTTGVADSSMALKLVR